MRNLRILFPVIIVASLISGPCAEGAMIKNGDSCSPIGATYKQGSINFSCIKSGNSSIWKASTKKASPTPTVTYFTMPNVAGMNLQLAQDLLQSKGSYLMDQTDAKGLGRVQLLDSNWKVCRQSPSAGSRVSTSTLVTLASVKLIESC